MDTIFVFNGLGQSLHYAIRRAGEWGSSWLFESFRSNLMQSQEVRPKTLRDLVAFTPVHFQIYTGSFTRVLWRMTAFFTVYDWYRFIICAKMFSRKFLIGKTNVKSRCLFENTEQPLFLERLSCDIWHTVLYPWRFRKLSVITNWLSVTVLTPICSWPWFANIFKNCIILYIPAHLIESPMPAGQNLWSHTLTLDNS